MRKIFLSKAVKCGAILLILFINNVSHSKAQQAYFWSAQDRIPEYLDDAEVPPFLIGDQNHTVHAFNSQPLALEENVSPKAIFYRQWTLQNGWTNPNDILFDSAGGNIELIGVSSDESGMAHLVFQMKGQEVYYAQAPLSDANTATAWSVPLRIGGQSLSIRSGVVDVGAIANEKEGNDIFIVYSGSQYGNGLYFVASSDGGNSWTNPYPIYLTRDENSIVYEPKLYWSELGIIHAVWGTRNQDGFAGPGYYANFNLHDNVWSDPMELDAPGINTPSIVEYDGNLFISYQHLNVNSNFWRRSSDGGKSWTYPSRLSPSHIGTNGAVSYVVDSNHTLHAFFGERIDASGTHGMWHTVWTGYDWTSPDAVVKGPKVTDVIGGKGFDPSAARAVIVNGNLVFVTWSTDGTSGTNGAWYSYKRLDAPELPSVLLPSPSLMAEQISTAVSPIATEIGGTENISNSIPQNILNAPQPSTRNPQAIIFLGIMPGLVIVLGILFLRYFYHTRKK